ncbi:MAG TPA: hypothetical protein VMV69_16860 [Pirellulales bacterium]|nr:hypothetical protein [Pirellulales bacterium]
MRAIIILTFATLLSSRAARAEVTFEDILENVKRNEALYENHDVKLTLEYEMGNVEAAKIMQTPGGPVVSEEIKAMSSSMHYVSQNGLFRLDRKGTNTTSSAELSADCTRAFDGTTTRLYAQGAIGNIIPGREQDHDFMYPHMLLERKGAHVPLSTFLSGMNAFEAHPLGERHEGQRFEYTYMGEDEVDGLRCHMVWSTIIQEPDLPLARAEFWLAEDRNYMPVRTRGFYYNYAKDIPCEEGVASDFREIGPGIWFPFRAEVTLYDGMTLMMQRKLEVRGRYRFAVEEASLHPSYEQAYFKDVVFPDGTAVYEVENSQIKKIYRIGAPDAHAGGEGKSKRWWLIVAFNAAAALAVVVVVATSVVRRRARRAIAVSSVKGVPGA